MLLAEQRLSDPAWWKKLDELLQEEIERTDGHPQAAAIPVLQFVQSELRYLPEEVVEYVADALGMTVAQIYGLASFYAFFSMEPRGLYMVDVCLGTACYVGGSPHILRRFCDLLDIAPGGTSADGLFTVRAVRCMGACSRAPVVMVNGRVHSRVKVTDVERIIRTYRKLAEESAP